jgi:ketosteroid isomerase-like protein
MTRKVAIGLSVVVAAAALFFLWPSEERRVRERLEALAEAVSMPATETDLERLARAQRVRGWMREDVRVVFEQAEWPPIEGRDALAAVVARRWGPASARVKVDLEDLTISLAPDGASAVARFKARVVSLEQPDEPATLDGRMVSVSLQRAEGEWVVASARILRSDDAAR